ncbi:MAG: hypothetical protein A3I66_11085 [Burkholderiales bacterium RIFCSPLOWO2_02_FULL_57_36]|nr:MAG: hypothetical protein A3I66_11085 [Burkholderiales bacterium RIFCSPLOWO2_02_FULL_57_36]
MNPLFNNMRPCLRKRAAGFSLIELMIASAIGLIILAALTYVFLESSASRTELTKSSRQIENGRYGIEEMRREIQLAGFYGEFSGRPVPTWTTTDPCAITLTDMGFASAGYGWNTSANTLVPVGIFGYRDSDATPSCISNRKANTDILVIRRVSTTAINIDANNDNVADANVDTNGDGATDSTYSSLGSGHYLQVSNCSDIPAESLFVVDHDTTKFTRHKAIPAGTPSTCLSGSLSTLRRLVVQIYYISTCNDCSGTGDGIPTLRLAELRPASATCAAAATTACGTWVTIPIAEGIENLQLEYGIDSPVVDGAPDTYSDGVIADWSTVVAVKVFLLARNTEPTFGYSNSKQYILNSAGIALTAFNDSYKRNVYSASVMATNIAGRRMP